MGEPPGREPAVEIGEVVEGRYKIVKQLGEGGMGAVFLAEHWLIKRKVALKVLHRELVEDADVIRRFMNEALAAGTLGHPNIVESTDMGFTRTDVPYIVFEYIEGSLLSDEVYRLNGLPVRRALRIAHQVASALSAAHEASIVHRDLKSDNIYLTDRQGVLDHVKVLDFGISRFQQASDRTGVGGLVMGTPEFMAPEQITNPDAVDKRADIYALGVVLYEMLAGRLPFTFGTRPESGKHEIDAMHELLHRIIQEEPPLMVRPDAPPGLAEMIDEKLLAKDPAKRYQSMSDVRGAIEAFTSVLQRSGPVPTMRRAQTADPSLETQEPDDAELDRRSDQTVSRAHLDPEEVAREVKHLGTRWVVEGASLKLELFSRSMTKLAAAIMQVSAVADEINHFPAIVVAYPRVTVTIHAFDPEGITVLDLVFAARVEQWLRANGW